jgi:hypothetical protein
MHTPENAELETDEKHRSKGEFWKICICCACPELREGFFSQLQFSAYTILLGLRIGIYSALAITGSRPARSRFEEEAFTASRLLLSASAF